MTSHWTTNKPNKTVNEENHNFRKVSEKWGFGMAPPKAKTQRSRDTACANFLEVLRSEQLSNPDEHVLQSLSIVKGLFNRIVREDQWDWFTVAGQLGYPSRRISDVIAKEIKSFRTAIKSQNAIAFWNAQTNLRRLPTRRCLSVFLRRAAITDEFNAGWIYVLSTRELPDLLKVGMTTRTVEQRAQEINGATGVALPFGVRRCWRVSDPAKVEKRVHQALHEFRLRNDREFFRVSFRVAVQLIDTLIHESSLEIRTLDALGGLTPTS